MNSTPSFLANHSPYDGRRLWICACVCLLMVAAALRFYNLSDSSLGLDEARAAISSRGTLSEAIAGARYENSSAMLYPIALWAVQKAAAAEFGSRLLSAVASLLTVVALLFWMPRLGVARRAAFLAALLAALSVAAIEQAQDLREYSVDALIAALMAAGALRYLRDGKRGLLCAALFAGPLLHYGLALFGVAVIGAAALAPGASPQTDGGGGRDGYGAGVWERLTRRRVELLLPIGAFAAACALSWALTLRYQWTDGGWDGGAYLAGYYYRSGFDAAAAAEFAIGRTWGLLSYHMPPIAAAVALLGFAGLLPRALRRRRLDAVALLALFGVGIALCAALAGGYPFGDIRQCLYLGPIVFLAAGGAFNALAGAAAAKARRAWPAAALTVMAAGAIALGGAADIRQNKAYQSEDGIERVFAALEARQRPGDGVYVSHWGVPLVEFYKREKPNNYYYGQTFCGDSTGGECASEMFDEMFSELGGARRIWLIHAASFAAPKEMAAYSQEVEVEGVVDGGWVALHLITGHEGVAAEVHIQRERLELYEYGVSGVLAAAADYDVYIQDKALYYAKRPCAAADTEAHFFLHIFPKDARDLHAGMIEYGLDILDFDFRDYGFLAVDRCIIRRDLPDYPIERILTGQFIYPDGPVIWESEFPFEPFNLSEWLGMYEAAVSAEPSAESTYDVYIRDNALHYAKQPCARADTEAHFFLNIYPEDAGDLPERRRQYGHDIVNFKFQDYGLRAAGKCLARRELSDYPIRRIHTGQYVYPDGPIIWEAEFPFRR